jgi:hypothetical protein
MLLSYTHTHPFSTSSSSFDISESEAESEIMEPSQPPEIKRVPEPHGAVCISSKLVLARRWVESRPTDHSANSCDACPDNKITQPRDADKHTNANLVRLLCKRPPAMACDRPKMAFVSSAKCARPGSTLSPKTNREEMF